MTTRLQLCFSPSLFFLSIFILICSILILFSQSSLFRTWHLEIIHPPIHSFTDTRTPKTDILTLIFWSLTLRASLPYRSSPSYHSSFYICFLSHFLTPDMRSFCHLLKSQNTIKINSKRNFQHLSSTYHINLTRDLSKWASRKNAVSHL